MTSETENKILEQLSGIFQRFDQRDQVIDQIAKMLLDVKEEMGVIHEKLDDKVSHEEFLKAHDEIVRLLSKHDDEIGSLANRSKEHSGQLEVLAQNIERLKERAGMSS